MGEGFDLTCTTSDEIVPGEAEYQSACIAAGGAEVGRFSTDYVCQLNWYGSLGTLVTLHARDTLICFPSDDEFDACFDPMVDGMMIGYKDT